MKYLTQTVLTVLVFAAACLTSVGADATGESAKVNVTCLVPKAVSTFSGTLELRLYKVHPMIADKPAELVEKLEVREFSHTEGADTKKELEIGAGARLDPAMKYYITCYVLDAKGSRTHMGASEDGKALCTVLTQGNPNLASFKVRKL